MRRTYCTDSSCHPSFYQGSAPPLRITRLRFSPLTEAPSFYQKVTEFCGKFAELVSVPLRRLHLSIRHPVSLLSPANTSFSPLTEAPSFYRFLATVSQILGVVSVPLRRLHLSISKRGHREVRPSVSVPLRRLHLSI